ncbi:MAG: NADH-quinone oxidoreductase subunit L, partial [Halobacteria archaeon]|nr:NADH-quinone oxidoreductase subunit L [Halobacteria archaeon]
MALIDYAWLIPVVPFVSFAVILLGGLLPKEKGFGSLPSTLIATAATLVSLALSLAVFAGTWGGKGEAHVVKQVTWTTGVGKVPDLTFGVLVDPLSALMLVIVSLVAFLVHVFSKGYMNDEGETGLPRYYAGLGLFSASMLAFVLA